jgi:hypothetical protein
MLAWVELVAWGGMERGDLGFSLPQGVFKDLGNILAKWVVFKVR